MKGTALAKNEVKHNIFSHLSVFQIFLAGSFVAFRLTAAYSIIPRDHSQSVELRLGPFSAFSFQILKKRNYLAQRQPQTTNPNVGNC